MTEQAHSAGSAELRRVVSLPWLVLYGLGTTIGAGIYALTGVVAGRAGMHAPLAFGLAALIALFSALSFAELSSRFPRAGGEAVYVKEGFGSVRLSVAIGVLVVLSGLISAATVSVGFAGYVGEFLALPKVATVLVVVVILGALAAWGVQESVTAAGILTLLEIGGLLAVIAYGGPQLAMLPERSAEIFRLEPGALHAIGSAAVLSFFAFLGFEDMVNVAEEVRDVERTLPAAILLTVVITAVLYVLVSSVAILAVPPEELGSAAAPLALVFERCGGPAQVLGGIAIFALLNGALIQIIKASRVLFSLAGQGGVPTVLGRVNPRTRTPLVATALCASLAAALAATLPLETLAEATSVVTLLTFSLANLALLRIKRLAPPPSGVRTFPAWVPAIGFVLTSGLLGLELLGRLGAR